MHLSGAGMYVYLLGSMLEIYMYNIKLKNRKIEGLMISVHILYSIEVSGTLSTERELSSRTLVSHRTSPTSLQRVTYRALI